MVGRVPLECPGSFFEIFEFGDAERLLNIAECVLRNDAILRLAQNEPDARTLVKLTGSLA